jgi:tankyrase
LNKFFNLFIGFGRKDVVEYLLSQNANVHMKDDGGLIPLHNAASFGHAEVVQLLLNHHSNVNALDSWNFSPLAEAASKGKVDVCLSMLLKSSIRKYFIYYH